MYRPLISCCLSYLQVAFKGNGTKVAYLEPQEWGSGAACDKLEQFPLFLVSEPLHNSPEDFDDRVVGRVAPWEKRSVTKNKAQARAGPLSTDTGAVHARRARRRGAGW